MGLVEEFEARKRLWPPELREMFHKLWTKAAVAQAADYDKKEWSQLEQLIERELLRR